MAEPAEETPAQRQARLRREKRNARIASEGSDRLAKISGLSGRAALAAEHVSQPSRPSVAPDPDEVDISEHHWTPGPQRLPPSTSSALPNPDLNADPMMQMMQQMLSGVPQPDSSNSGMPDLNSMMAQMLSGQAQAATDAAQPVSDTAYLWRIVHAVFALSLALYTVTTVPFTGSKLARYTPLDAADAVGPNLFFIFATVEAVLQSGRYFLEKGQLQGGGWLATIANSGMVPEPWVGYIRVVGRYMTIWNTIVGDIMVIVFVLGVVAWWRGTGAAA